MSEFFRNFPIARTRPAISTTRSGRSVLLAALLGSFVPGIICGVLLLGSPGQLVAQINSASLQGTVTDGSGAAVDGAQVNVENSATNSVRSTITNATGAYSIQALEPGTYTVTISKTGFSTFRQTNLTLEVGQIATLDQALKVGSVTEVVEVSAETATIQTADTTLGGVITTREVVDLPLNGRMFTQLLQLEPGTVPVDLSQNNGKQPGFGPGSPIPAINGGTNRSNLFYIDGIYATDPFFAGFRSAHPSTRFRSSRNRPTPIKPNWRIYGSDRHRRNPAGNQLLPRRQLSNFCATPISTRETLSVSPQRPSDQVPYHQNQFGGTFGGPIIKNKLFFFAYYEGGARSRAAFLQLCSHCG